MPVLQLAAPSGGCKNSSFARAERLGKRGILLGILRNREAWPSTQEWLSLPSIESFLGKK